MNTKRLLIALVLAVALLLAGCDATPRVGALRTESQTVELGDAGQVRVEIDFGAGDLNLRGGANKLLEAGFNYNVAKLKPVVSYKNGDLVVRQPATRGLPALQNITDFRNEWDLRLYDQVPMDLSVDMGGGTSNLQLAGLALTRLAVRLGAGKSMVDLSGNWAHDLDVTINSGAADLTVRLPGEVGVRVEVNEGPTMVEAPGFTQDGSVYTNAAYGVSDVTLQVKMEPGIGFIYLEEAQARAVK